MKLLEFHEVANIFPLMEGDEYKALCNDIQANGLLEAIWLHPDGSILDGRNRYRACLHVGKEPKFETWRGVGELEFVLSKNLHRRHLNESQRAMIAARLANAPRGQQPNTPIGIFVTQPEAAKMLNVSTRSVQRAETIQNEGTPETIEAVERGDLAVSRATQQIKQKKKQAGVKAYSEKVKEAPPLQKTYNVIYADPPWKYSKSINTLDAVTDSHYSTMSLDEVRNYLHETKIRVANDAVLFLWVTNPFLELALDVVDAWGFNYKTNIVWIKTELKKPGVGYYVRGRHELLYICTRGSFTPLDKNISPPVGSTLESPVREHSQKPLEVYNIIERLYPGCTYLELFARNKRPGWDCIGDEA